MWEWELVFTVVGAGFVLAMLVYTYRFARGSVDLSDYLEFVFWGLLMLYFAIDQGGWPFPSPNLTEGATFSIKLGWMVLLISVVVWNHGLKKRLRRQELDRAVARAKETEG